jgi:pyridoxine 5-phosphate synthase
MRRLILELDGLPGLRDAMGASDVDVPAAATIAELAGVDGVRLGVNLDLKPVSEGDVHDTRRAARRLELRMPPSEKLLKVALETRPDRVVLAADGRDGVLSAAPLDLRLPIPSLHPVVRALQDAGTPVTALIAPSPDSIKAVHAEGIEGVELYTGTLVDLPAIERRGELERLGDAARLASKLHMRVGVSGGLGYRSLHEILEVAVGAQSVCVGRAALARAVLVGLDTALRDLRTLVA